MKKHVLKRSVLCAGMLLAAAGVGANGNTAKAAGHSVGYLFVDGEETAICLSGTPVIIKDSTVNGRINIYVDANKNGIVDAGETKVELKDANGVTSADIKKLDVYGEYNNSCENGIFITNEATDLTVYGAYNKAIVPSVTIYSTGNADIYGACGQCTVNGDININANKINNNDIKGLMGSCEAHGDINISVESASSANIQGSYGGNTVDKNINIGIKNADRMVVFGENEDISARDINLDITESNGSFYGIQRISKSESGNVTVTARKSYGEFYGATNVGSIKGTVKMDVKDTEDTNGELQKVDVYPVKNVGTVEAVENDPAIDVSIENAQYYIPENSAICKDVRISAACPEGAYQLNLKNVHMYSVKDSLGRPRTNITGLMDSQILAEENTAAYVVNATGITYDAAANATCFFNGIKKDPYKKSGEEFDIVGDVVFNLEGIEDKSTDDCYKDNTSGMYLHVLNCGVDGNVTSNVKNMKLAGYRVVEANSKSDNVVVRGNVSVNTEKCSCTEWFYPVHLVTVVGDVAVTADDFSVFCAYAVDNANVVGNVLVDFTDCWAEAKLSGVRESTVSNNVTVDLKGKHDFTRNTDYLNGTYKTLIGGSLKINIEDMGNIIGRFYAMDAGSVSGKTDISIKSCGFDNYVWGVMAAGNVVHDATISFDDMTVPNAVGNNQGHYGITGVDGILVDSEVHYNNIHDGWDEILAVVGKANDVKVTAKDVALCSKDTCTLKTYIKTIDGDVSGDITIDYENVSGDQLEAANNMWDADDEANVEIVLKDVTASFRSFFDRDDEQVRVIDKMLIDHCSLRDVQQKHVSGKEDYKDCHVEPEVIDEYTTLYHVVADERTSTDDPENPTVDPENPTVDPENPTDNPDDPAVKPENPADKPVVKPEDKTTESNSATTTENQKVELPVEESLHVGDVIDMKELDLIYVVTKDTAGAGEVVVKGARNKNIVNVIIPKELQYNDVTYKVTAIADKAFANSKKLKTVTISTDVKKIGNSAFEGCKKLTKVTISKDVSKIGKKAFYNCKALKTLKIYTTKLTNASVGSKAFKNAGKNNYKKLKVKVPSKKLKAYKKLLVKKGLSKKAKIVK